MIRLVLSCDSAWIGEVNIHTSVMYRHSLIPILFVYLCFPFICIQGAPGNLDKGTCCFNPQFEGIFHRETTVFNNKLETTSTETRLHFDHAGKRVCNEFSTPSTGPIRVVNDYQTGLTYTIMKKNGVCFKKPNTEILRPHCIPENANFDGRVSINDMNLNRWSTRNGSEKITYIVTDIGCVPVQVSVYSENMQQVNYFYNISQGISDFNVFNYPKDCVPDPSVTKHDTPK